MARNGRKQSFHHKKAARQIAPPARKPVADPPATDRDKLAVRLKADLLRCSRTKFVMTERDGKGNILNTVSRQDRPGEKYLTYISGIADPDLSSTILLEIPSYCDPELRNTMEAARKMAANPDRIRFAVCLQDDDADIRAYLDGMDGCRVRRFAEADAPGTCAARYECQQLYGGEDFVFHIDPHMRFARYWDVAILDQWRRCGDPKAILSTWGVDLRKDDLSLPVDSDLFDAYVPVAPGKLDGRTFVEGPGIISGLYFVEGRWDLRFSYGHCFYDFQPRPGAFICAHYVFGPGRSDRDVPVDRYMDFTGDELAVAVRYYTNGYNIYHPGCAFVYHLWRRDLIYGKDGKRAPSGSAVRVDDKTTRKQRQIRRVEKLLGLEDHPDVDLGEFRLGTERSLSDFEAYSGVCFQKAEMSRFCYDGTFGREHSGFEESPREWYPAAVRSRGEAALGWFRKLRDSDPAFRARQEDVAAWRMTEDSPGDGAFGIDGLRVVTDGADAVVLGWNGVKDQACLYVVQGVADDLHFETLAKTERETAAVPKAACAGYAGFRVIAFTAGDSGVLLAESDVLRYDAGKSAYAPIGLLLMPSYGDRVAVVFRHEGMYANYCLYDCAGGKKDLVLSSEDMVLSTGRLIPGHTYVAEGYAVKDGRYVLAGRSGAVEYDGSGWTRPGLDGRKPDLSVIMPVCNVEKYLARAIDSILGCDMESLELFLIDDKSEDGSSAICAWYEDKYDFVHVLHMDRCGPAECRNEGLAHASGEWIAFMDSDDAVHPYSYRKLREAALKTGAPVSIMGTVIRDKFGTYKFVLNPFGADSTDDVDVCGMRGMFVDNSYSRRYWCSVANKIVRADVARKVKCPERSYFPNKITAYEDYGYTPALYSYAGRFAIARGAYYVWERRHKKLFDAESYYWGDRNGGTDSHESYIYGRMYAIYACNPENRLEVDYRTLIDLEKKWSDCGDKASMAVPKALLAKLVTDADGKYGFRGNPYVSSNKNIIAFLDACRELAGN